MTRILRPLERGDLPELIELCREHARYERAPWAAFDRMARLEALLLDAEGARCWVVEGAGELAGFASAMLERSTWDAGCFLHLDCLYLRERYRGEGSGSRMMEAVARAALELGALDVRWQTPPWNERAIRFYRRLGASGAERVRFYLGRDECAALADGEPAGP